MLLPMSTPKPPKPQLVTDTRELPPHIQKALNELVAYTINGQSPLQIFNLGGLSHEGQPLGDWEIRITRVDL